MKYKTLRSSAVQGAFVLEAHLWALSRAGQGRSVQRGSGAAGTARLPGTAEPASSWRSHQAGQVANPGIPFACKLFPRENSCPSNRLVGCCQQALSPNGSLEIQVGHVEVHERQ